MGHSIILHSEIKSNDDFKAMLIREQTKKNPLEPFVCLAAMDNADKIWNAYNNMINKKFPDKTPY